ncbi:translation initiation factor IF-1 [Akkermansia muciniphila]|uniref:translation initiation factor IF-1 n=1 Tax=Akkermansia muciniphila TaxID=239935 RepID=UPI0031B58178
MSPNPRSSSRPSGGQNSRTGSRPTGTGNRPGQSRSSGNGTGASRPAGQSAGPGNPRTGGGSRPGGNANRQRPQGGGGRHTKGRKHFSKSEPKEENSESEIEVEGTICAVLAGTMFKVRLPNGHEVLAHISGKMRKRFIKIVVGDKVRMEMSPYDMTKARITFRIG